MWFISVTVDPEHDHAQLVSLHTILSTRLRLCALFAQSFFVIITLGADATLVNRDNDCAF